MSKNNDDKDKFLENEIGNVGFKSGLIGGLIGGGLPGGIGGAKGGKLGASWAASKLPTDEVRDKITLEENLRTSMITVVEALSSIGTIINRSKDMDCPVVSGWCGSGFANMNPAIICVEFKQINNTQTGLYIFAYAKEGLIKQKTALKAIAKLKAMIIK